MYNNCPYDIYIYRYIDTCCVLIDLSITILSKLGSTERGHLGINQLSGCSKNGHGAKKDMIIAVIA